MSAMLFGVCGCCGGLTYESQSVKATVRYNFGWEIVKHLDWDGTPLPDAIVPMRLASQSTGMHSPYIWTPGVEGSGVPASVFLTRTTKYYDGSTGALVNTYVEQYDAYGKLTTIGWAGWPDYVAWRESEQTLSDPYTYAQAVDLCKQLLALVTLLNPSAAYQLADGGTVHLCYPSEAAAYSTSCSGLALTYDEDGKVVIVVDPVGGGVAANGLMYIDLIYSGIPTGLAVCIKSALRHPAPLLSRMFLPLKYPYLSGGASPYVPIRFDPGEHIFDPSDVVDGIGAAAYGLCVWDVAVPPGLPMP